MVRASMLAVGLVIVGAVCGFARPIRFGPAQNVTSGLATPLLLATGDFNRDGNPDLVASDGISAITILLGAGDGTLAQGAAYTLDTYVQRQVAVADFNGDRKLDLAVTGGSLSGNFGLTLLLGNGDGTFGDPVYFDNQLNGSGIAAAVGDLNKDGHLDIVFGGNGAGADVLGNADGGFDPKEVLPFAGFGILLADLNHDGKLDVAAGGGPYQFFTVALGNGDGTFQAAVSYPGGNWGGAVSAGDFNRDGNVDLAVADAQNTVIYVFLGLGDGSFSTPSFAFVGSGPSGVVTADFNQDGILDLATAVFNQNRVAVAAGNGDGTFSGPSNFSVGQKPSFTALGDFNKDGSLDLAVPDNGNGMVSVLLNADGTSVLLSSSNNPSQVGEPVTFTAVVSATVDATHVPQGNVTFKDGSAVLGRVVLENGVASLTTSSLTQGKHNIRALYSGNRLFNPNRSLTLVQHVE